MKTERMIRHESVLTLTLTEEEVAKILREYLKLPGAQVNFEVRHDFLDAVVITDTKVSFSGPTTVDDADQPTGQG